MRIALFSDVHGNWTALQEVWTAIQSEGGFDAVVCAGDLACFRPHPEECLCFLQEHAAACVLGNTDLYLLGSDGPGPEAARRYPFLPAQAAWCRERVSEGSRRFLRELPRVLRFPARGSTGDLVVCHATPTALTPVCPPDAPDSEWAAVMGEFDGAAVAFGHVHVPGIRSIDGRLYVNVAHCGLGNAAAVGYTVLTDTPAGWTAERRPVVHDPHPEYAYALAQRFPGADQDRGY